MNIGKNNWKKWRGRSCNSFLQSFSLIAYCTLRCISRCSVHWQSRSSENLSETEYSTVRLCWTFDTIMRKTSANRLVVVLRIFHLPKCRIWYQLQIVHQLIWNLYTNIFSLVWWVNGSVVQCYRFYHDDAQGNVSRAYTYT